MLTESGLFLVELLHALTIVVVKFNQPSLQSEFRECIFNTFESHVRPALKYVCVIAL